MKTNVEYDFLSKLLDVIEHHILPLTVGSVKLGNKVFGAAILKKSDFSLITVETNNEIKNPLLHGEVNCLNKFFERSNNDKAYNTRDLIFLSTHEPCSMCLSAITWSGFDNIYYFFDYEDSRDNFKIPHDLKILEEVFKIKNGKYNKHNSFWHSTSIISLVLKLSMHKKNILLERVSKIKVEYQKISENYQLNKSNNNIPLR